MNVVSSCFNVNRCMSFFVFYLTCLKEFVCFLFDAEATILYNFWLQSFMVREGLTPSENQSVTQSDFIHLTVSITMFII